MTVIPEEDRIDIWFTQLTLNVQNRIWETEDSKMHKLEH